MLSILARSHALRVRLARTISRWGPPAVLAVPSDLPLTQASAPNALIAPLVVIPIPLVPVLARFAPWVVSATKQAEASASCALLVVIRTVISRPRVWNARLASLLHPKAKLPVLTVAKACLGRRMGCLLVSLVFQAHFRLPCPALCA